MGLSDGAHIDLIRRTSSGILSNEQFVQITQIGIEKWEDLLGNLRKDLGDPQARFCLVYLINDFTATGTSFLRAQKQRNGGEKEWKGKLIRFRDSVKKAIDDLKCDKPFEDNWRLCIHHYVASHAAVDAIGDRLDEINSTDIFFEGWAQAIYTSFGMIFRHDFPINAVSKYHKELIQLTEKYYDSIIQTKHTDIGGVRHLHLGYGGCALPLVLEHNTPNNSIALLWAATDGDACNGKRVPAMRPLFLRRQRHL